MTTALPPPDSVDPWPNEPTPRNRDADPAPDPKTLELPELIRLARDQGDEAARNELLARYYPVVRRIVHRDLQGDLRHRRPWLWAMFSTGDIVQDVFLGAIRDLRGFLGNDEGALVKYLATLVRNRLIDAVRFYEADRRDARRGVRESTEHGLPTAVADDPTPSFAAALAEQVETFRDVLESLSIRDRSLIALRLERDEPFAKIAEELSIPTADAARKAFVSAQARLLVALRSRGFSDGGTRANDR